MPAPTPDDDRTVIRVPGKPASGDASRAAMPETDHTLPLGTRIEGFEIRRLIGEGGFGIVYLAYDASLDRQVAVKEYMPSSLAARASGSYAVTIKSERHRETFAAGLKSFVNEARLLARFDHPSLVKVYRFWEANGTAYMAMPFYEGPTLKRALAERSAPPDEATLRGWLAPLLDALAEMHQEHCYHRDIAPDNILLTPSGPLLLDFGAARHVIGGMTQALTVVLKPGYAPVEQYGESSAMTQGPWTDLYALGSVVYCAITGRAPISSVERLMDDALPPLARIAAGHYSDTFLRAVDAALAVRPKERPQDVAQFRALIAGPSGAAPAARAAPAERTLPRPPPLPVLPPPPPPRPPVAAPAAAPRRPLLREAQPMPALAAPNRRALWIGAAVLVGSAVVGVPLLMRRETATPPEPVPEPQAASAPSPAPAPVTIPPAAPVLATPPAAAPVPAPDAVASAIEPPARRPAARERAAAAPSAGNAGRARCSEILQKASLESITADEAAFLKRECR